jgi:hypothetical protein
VHELEYFYLEEKTVFQTIVQKVEGYLIIQNDISIFIENLDSNQE